MTITAAPIVILIRPQMGENIGAAARAMSNFGLSELRLVAPRDGWPNAKASDMASRGKAIIENARLYTDFTDAMADIHVAYATTARPRDMVKRVVSPATAMQEIAANSTSSHKMALVFGPERTGIENEEITLCDNIITIPTSDANPSLNLAQSAVILGYEWVKTIESRVLSAEENSNNLAPKKELFDLFEQLENYLDQTNYFRTESKKTIMWQNLRNMLMRGAWNEQEIRSFRGMLRALWEKH